MWKKWIPVVLVFVTLGGLLAYGFLRGMRGPCPCPNCRERIYGPGKCLIDFTKNFWRGAFFNAIRFVKGIEFVDESSWRIKKIEPNIWRVEGKVWVTYLEFREKEVLKGDLYQAKALYSFFLVAELLPDRNWKAIDGDVNLIKKTAQKLER